ncbi:MAG TPA: hypothetical protein DHV89_00430 [Ruminococcus sp.]|nr:hypothetical protein [Ruminococcus sp.]
MKKTKKTRMIAALLTAAAGLAGCRDPLSDEVQAVYGPPPASDNTSAEASADSSQAEDSSTDSTAVLTNVTLSSAADSYDPSEEEIEDVYGPPEYFNGEEEEEVEEAVSEADNSYDPSEEERQYVYGPPEWLE